MLAFGWLFNIMERGRASYDRVEKILSQKSDVVNRENAVHTIASGDVSFAVDSFSYKKNELLHLTDIHFDLKKGNVRDCRTYRGRENDFIKMFNP